MSDYGPGSAIGGMSPEGQTTRVGVNGRLSKKDRVVLCQVLCKCKKIGVATRNGRIQRQKCVQQRLDFANETSRMETGTPTEYRPEQTYDMKAVPPEPVTDPEDPLRPHSDLRQWIEDFWPGGREMYKAGAGNLRRPDVVIVNDPTQPPVQSNIKQVVEFKFPPDDYGRNQERDYVRIAGSRSKFVPLGPAECGCGDDEPDGEKSSQRQSKSSSDMDELLGGSSGHSMSSGSGFPPALPPLPPVPAFP
ncbi:VRR-NUC domain-containing protein [Burkholderia guangdongensis]|uniref:VRR-NUC domain-containing protein n=1 Tax=Burkholderia guangdongensis TaxID=1792500 RepID=UPI0015CAB53F|nr:VRR-NUC domain-containing protein [Burkholderia guangdongensis]